MKTWKKLAALCCAATMTLALTACGGDGGTAGDAPKAGGTEDTKAILTAAQTKMQEAKSVQADMVMDMNIAGTVQGQEITMKMNMDMAMQTISDPMKMKANMKLVMDMGAMAGGAAIPEQNVELYMTEEDGTYKTYTNTAGIWTTETVDATALGQYDPKASMDIYLKSADSFKKGAEEEIQGMKATKYSGIIKSEALDEIMAASGMDKQMETLGMPAEDVANLYKDMGDMPVDLWINEEGYPVRYEMDMSEMMNKMFAKFLEKAAGAELSEADMQMKCDVKISMDCYNFDKVEDFTIPAEALAA